MSDNRTVYLQRGVCCLAIVVVVAMLGSMAVSAWKNRDVCVGDGVHHYKVMCTSPEIMESLAVEARRTGRCILDVAVDRYAPRKMAQQPVTTYCPPTPRGAE